MTTHIQQAGGTRRIRLDVPIRAFWSQQRAWHGDKLALHVETAYLPDQTRFTLRIYEACANMDDKPEPIDVIDSGLELVKNRASIPYTIAWDRAARGKPLELRSDRYEFLFEVSVAHPKVIGRSNLLYVHLHPHVVSG